MTLNDIHRMTMELKISQLQAYLQYTGWKCYYPEYYKKKISGESYQVILPKHRAYADYKDRIVDLVRNLAKVENRPLDQVFTDLAIPPGDIIRFKDRKGDKLAGTISFLEGCSILENAKCVLTATAYDVIRPEPYHNRLSSKEVLDFIKSCKLGQTERGSFIASVICPLVNQCEDNNDKTVNIFEQPDELSRSFSRQVTIHLMKSLSKIKTTIDRGEEYKLLRQEGKEIVSGNFLESLVGLYSVNENAEIEISMSWSVFATRPRVLKSIKFTKEYIPVIESLIHKLKP